MIDDILYNYTDIYNMIPNQTYRIDTSKSIDEDIKRRYHNILVYKDTDNRVFYIDSDLHKWGRYRTHIQKNDPLNLEVYITYENDKITSIPKLGYDEW